MVSALAESIHVLQSMFAIKPTRQVREMYAFLLFFSFAAALITIFEPIFFFKEGFSIWEISLYYALHYTLYAFALPVGGMIASRLGYEKSLTLSTPVFIVYFLMLASLPSFPQLFWVALLVLTLFKILYWPAYHANFSAYTDGKNRGTEQSWVRLVKLSTGILGPLLGGFIALKFGFPALFLVSATAVALAGLSLLRTKEEINLRNLDYWEPWQLILSRRYRRMVWGMIGFGENLIYLTIWPIFIFIAIGSVEIIGLIASLGTALATIVGFVTGELTDRLSPRKMLKRFVPVVSLVYLLRLFATTAGRTLTLDVLSRGTIVLVNIPVLVKLYTSGRGAGALRYAVAFEVVLAITKALTAFAIGLLFAVTPLSLAFAITFIAAAILTLFYLAL